jgi:coatomer protein complex subunit alpha (xenin)
VQAQIKKLVEYITAMRIEIERRKVAAAATPDQTRVCELACLMTLCKLEPGHKFLVLRSAFQLLYKNANFITASFFARQIISLESSGIFDSKPDIVPQYKKYFQACQNKGSNALKLKFKPEDSAQVTEITSYLCAGSLTQLEDNRSVSTVKCPLTGAVYAKSTYNNKVCSTCDMVKLGDDALGLNVMLEGMQQQQFAAGLDDPLGF